MTDRDPLREERVTASLLDLRRRCLALEEEHAEAVALSAETHRPSARNLLHYIAARQLDLRELQDDLAALGLSSLGRMEAHVLATVDAVLRTLGHGAADGAPPVDFDAGPRRLQHHTRALLGDGQGRSATRIMVTMGSDAADRPELVERLVAAGMDVMRINSAHDDPDAWARMIGHLRRAERAVGRSCQVYADLAGPKLRTGAIASAGRVMKARPERDSRGNVVAPASLWLTPSEAPSESPCATVARIVPIEDHGDLLARARPGDTLTFSDCRGRRRRGNVTTVGANGLLVDFDRTLYIETGLRCVVSRGERRVATFRVGVLPECVDGIELVVGDALMVEREGVLGRPAVRDRSGHVLEPARIGCSLAGAFECVRPGEAIWFDDGRIGSVVREIHAERIVVEVTDVPGDRARLLPEKGVNLPDTELDLPSLTEKDLEDLDFLADRVDMIGMSFVRRPEDILDLEDRLAARGHADVGLVLKIETRRAFENLPGLLLAGMRSPPVGVMVARGDLAVEVGFERLAEVQEEILWLAEAAHVPVIWATQVLEGLAKRGRPTRAEVSDVVMSHRAECVMLNKGPHIVDAVLFLRSVFERMDPHQSKKRARLRRLEVASLPRTDHEHLP